MIDVQAGDEQPLSLPIMFAPDSLLGRCRQDAAETPLTGAAWYTAESEGDGLAYQFPAGTLAMGQYMVADFLVDGAFEVVLDLTLQEGADGPAFRLSFFTLNQCQARLRLPLEAVNQNRWQLGREGACMKPSCYGDPVDLEKVDRMTLTVLRKAPGPVRWCMTPLTVTQHEPDKLTAPLLPVGPLIDELGQSTLHEWPEKSRSREEVTARLHTQVNDVPARRWPGDWSRWGGWMARTWEATGFFRTQFADERWWLVDPDGHPFWSAGLDCVVIDTSAHYDGLEAALSWLPAADPAFAPAFRGRHGGAGKSINYLAANLISALGRADYHARWAEIALGELRRLGFNTVGNWSQWEIARAAGFPYVRPLHPTFPSTPLIFRDFPDVFHPGFLQDVTAFAEQLRETAEDPALIGYFLMNEPTWGFAAQTPAYGMLLNTPSCRARQALADFLRQRHGDDAGLAAAWGVPATLADVANGEWHHALGERACADLADFSTFMVDRLFGGLTAACRVVDPHHLNLGIRYYTTPPAWALAGMHSFDVFSMNCYEDRVPPDRVAYLVEQLNVPVMIGEYHFGALDAGLPGSGIGHVRNQAARGQAYRVYLETAAALPGCVGVHYFTMYDESALGRFDGENWNIGFLDVCNRPYEGLAEAARASHERLYGVASGELPPYENAPEYLPKLFG